MLLLALLAALTALATAAPAPMITISKSLSSDDIDTLHLALYLENLESNLFLRGCNGFQDVDYDLSGFPTGFRSEVCVIAQQEDFHITAIEEYLQANGGGGIPACTYQYPYQNPREFVELANKVTTVGIGAYMGAIKAIANDSNLRETAAAILAVEARHDAFLRLGINLHPFPTTFDTGLSAKWAYNLAQEFIVTCPVPLNIVKLPSLHLVGPNAGPLPPGTPVTLSWDPSEFLIKVDPTTPLFFAGVAENVTDPMFGPVTKINETTGTIQAPADAPSGVVYVVLTTFSGGLTLDQLTDYGTLAGPLEIMLS